jgi:hypothetical protein
MFDPIAYDEKHRTWLARFSGTLSEQDLDGASSGIGECFILHGPTAGLLDFSAVDSVKVTYAQIVSRGMRPQTMVGQKRAIVADGAVFGMMRVFGVYQSEHSVEPMIVRTLGQAYDALDLVAEDFHHVPLSPPLPPGQPWCPAPTPPGF